jgi:hypothetical protein
MKKLMRTKKATRAKKSSRLTTFTGFAGTIGGRTIFLVVIGIMATAMLIAARQESQPAANASVYVQPDKYAHTENAAAQVGSKKPAAVKALATAGTTSADGTDAVVPAVDTEAKADSPKSAPVTITGCLERNDETFRLKDTAGADAPKSRSWKSGFLKKGSAPIEVVDAAHRLKLPDHVGQRVSVTGKLVDREMQVRSLQRVAASCS